MIAVILFSLLTTACEAEDKSIGISLLFQSAGRRVVVDRFNPDGMRGPVPGSVGSMSPRGGKEMSFMPGDSVRGVPQFVDVTWLVPDEEYERWSIEHKKKSNAEKYGAEGNKSYRDAWAKVPNYTKRIDLTPILTPELIAQVRADAKNTQLKLIITFNNDEVEIKAIAYKWR